MSDEIIKEIFIAIASKAIEAAREIRLEKGQNNSRSNVLGGGFSESVTEYDSLSLHVYESNKNQGCDNEDEEEPDEEAEQ